MPEELNTKLETHCPHTLFKYALLCCTEIFLDTHQIPWKHMAFAVTSFPKTIREVSADQTEMDIALHNGLYALGFILQLDANVETKRFKQKGDALDLLDHLAVQLRRKKNDDDTSYFTWLSRASSCISEIYDCMVKERDTENWPDFTSYRANAIITNSLQFFALTMAYSLGELEMYDAFLDKINELNAAIRNITDIYNTDKDLKTLENVALRFATTNGINCGNNGETAARAYYLKVLPNLIYLESSGSSSENDSNDSRTVKLCRLLLSEFHQHVRSRRPSLETIYNIWTEALGINNS